MDTPRILQHESCVEVFRFFNTCEQTPPHASGYVISLSAEKSSSASQPRPQASFHAAEILRTVRLGSPANRPRPFRKSRTASTENG